MKYIKVIFIFLIFIQILHAENNQTDIGKIKILPNNYANVTFFLVKNTKLSIDMNSSLVSRVIVFAHPKSDLVRKGGKSVGIKCVGLFKHERKVILSLQLEKTINRQFGVRAKEDGLYSLYIENRNNDSSLTSIKYTAPKGKFILIGLE